MKQVDYLIIGQGICGSILAYELLQLGYSVMVVDQPDHTSSSRIAAGLFSPVTGRKMVKTWMFDEVFPYAFQYYRELENRLGCKFFHPEPLYHVLSSVKEVNDLSERFLRDEYLPLATFEQIPDLPLRIKAPLGTLRLNFSGWCEVHIVLDAIKELLQNKESIRFENFDYQLLNKESTRWRYAELSASAVIFCEGHHVRQNPYFRFIDMRPAKGEIITLHAPDLQLKHIIKQQHWIIPAGNNLFKVGATFDFNTINNIPTSSAIQELTKVFEQFFSTTYSIVRHDAAVRPAMHDRRPVLGEHPEHTGMFIFNGMGAKGVTQVPYFISLFLKYLIHASSLPKEVSINRFVD